MAGEIQLSGTTALTESSGAITLNNVNSATNRTNLGLGTAATSASTAFASSSTTITAGTGLSGGGDLSTNRTINVNFSANESNVKTALNASGDAGIYACRAWVHFEGNTGSVPGNKTINGSGNCSSVYENSNGNYTMNFTDNMPDAHYVVAGLVSDDLGHMREIRVLSGNIAAGSVRFIVGYNTDGSVVREADVMVAIFR